MTIQGNNAGKWVIDFTCKGKRITRVISESKREAETALAASAEKHAPVMPLK